MHTPVAALAAVVLAQAGDAGKKVEAEVQKAKALADQAMDVIWTRGPVVIEAILVFAVAWILAGWARRAIRRASERARVDVTLGKFFANLSRWLIIALAALSCLSIFGIQTASFAALIGAAGLAIGLAFQGSLGNFAAGVMLLVFRPFRVGDSVTVAGQSGVVNEIDLLITELDTADGRRIIIPNGQIFGSVIENTSHHPRRRVDANVVVLITADVDQTRELFQRAIDSVRPRLNDPAPEVVLGDLGQTTMTWALRVWTTREDFGATRDAVLRAAKLAIDEAGINVPPPAPAPLPPMPSPR
jgi:small conductance mechanosensitive channel